MDSLNSRHQGKTPSEQVAKDMLKDVLLGIDSKGKGIIVTTFSSHIARLGSIVEMAKKLDRKVLFLGRSLTKYVQAAERAGVARFDGVDVIRYKKHIKKKLRLIEKKKDKYLIVCTGHQGEKKSVLSRIATGNLPYQLDGGDHVVFSCKVIPSPVNLAARDELEGELIRKNVRIFKDVHVSGHASQEDHREFLQLLRPRMLIPSHGPQDLIGAMAEFAKELGYERGKNLALVKDGERLTIGR